MRKTLAIGSLVLVFAAVACSATNPTKEQTQIANRAYADLENSSAGWSVLTFAPGRDRIAGAVADPFREYRGIHHVTVVGFGDFPIAGADVVKNVALAANRAEDVAERLRASGPVATLAIGAPSPALREGAGTVTIFMRR